KGDYRYYPSLERIFEASGHHDVFDTTDPRAEAEAWARACARRYPPGRLPTNRSKDSISKRDASKICSLRMAKRGKGTCTYYPSVEPIFEAEGHHGVFGPERTSAPVKRRRRLGKCRGTSA